MDSILNISVLALGLISTLVFLVLYFTKLKSKQLLNYLPNVWTSLGILGTFIAIVYSLEDLQNSSSGNEINVIGLNVEEAVFVVDKFLDDASLTKLNNVRIVHGKGTGKLMKGIHKFLKTNPHVKSFRLGTYGEGEIGVTVVELK